MKPFNFPRMMGKLGNWPGIISVNAAQALLNELRQLPRDAVVGEVGFNGGRTTIIASWAAVENGFKIGVLGQIPHELAPWMRRALALFQLDRVLIGGLPQGANMTNSFDALIINAQVKIQPEFVDLIRPGGSLVVLHQPAPDLPGVTKMMDVANEIAVYRKEPRDYSIATPDQAQPERSFKVIKGGQALAQEESQNRREETTGPESVAIELPDGSNLDRATDWNEPSAVDAENSGTDPQALATDEGPVALDDLNGSGHRGVSEGDSEAISQE